MTVAEHIIAECESRGVILSLGESSSVLAFDAPAGTFTAELRRRVVAYKADIIEILYERGERAALSGCPEWMDARLWVRAVNSLAVQALARLGVQIVSVRQFGASSQDAPARAHLLHSEWDSKFSRCEGGGRRDERKSEST